MKVCIFSLQLSMCTIFFVKFYNLLVVVSLLSSGTSSIGPQTPIIANAKSCEQLLVLQPCARSSQPTVIISCWTSQKICRISYICQVSNFSALSLFSGPSLLKGVKKGKKCTYFSRIQPPSGLFFNYRRNLTFGAGDGWVANRQGGSFEFTRILRQIAL